MTELENTLQKVIDGNVEYSKEIHAVIRHEIINSQTKLSSSLIWQINKLPKPEDLLVLFIKLHMYEKGDEACLFEHPEEKDLLKLFIKIYDFSNECQLKMFQLPYAEEIIREYVECYILCDEAEMLLFTLPNAELMVRYYHNRRWLCRKALIKAQLNGWV